MEMRSLVRVKREIETMPEQHGPPMPDGQAAKNGSKQLLLFAGFWCHQDVYAAFACIIFREKEASAFILILLPIVKILGILVLISISKSDAKVSSNFTAAAA